MPPPRRWRLWCCRCPSPRRQGGAEGVTQTDSSVTAVVAGNMRAGQASVCCMGRVTGADVVPVDAGMLTEVEGLRSKERLQLRFQLFHGFHM